MPTWNPVVPYIAAGERVAAGVVNRPMATLAERTDYLKAIYESVTTNEFTYISNVAVSPACAAGDVVAWSSVNEQYEPALAAWSDSVDQYGALVPAESAVMAGILAVKHTELTGSVVTGGYIRNFQSLERLFGTATPAQGVYYMSASSAGKVTRDAPAMAVLALVYQGGGNVHIPTVRFEKATHDHKTYTLDSGMWLAANDTNFPNIPIPVDAEWGYNRFHATQEAVNAIFALYPGEAFLMNAADGTNILPEDYILDASDVWFKTVAAPADDITMYLTCPNSHGPGIVRAIQTNTPGELSVTLVNGLATVDKVAPAVYPDTAGYTVVKSVDSEGVHTGQVVEKIVPGPGIHLSYYSGAPGQGVVGVELASVSSDPVDASLVNLNNAMEVTADGVIYAAFPSARTSSMTAVVKGPSWGVGTTYGYIWMWVKGADSMPEVSVSVSVMVFQAPGTGGAAISEPSTHTITITGATDASRIYAFQTAEADKFTVPSGSLIQYTLSVANTYGVDVMLLRQGLVVGSV